MWVIRKALPVTDLAQMLKVIVIRVAFPFGRKHHALGQIRVVAIQLAVMKDLMAPLAEPEVTLGMMCLMPVLPLD